MKALSTFFQVLIVMLLTASSISAQFVTVGTATGENTITQQSPINIFYRSMHYQTIYTAAELSSAGFTAGATIQQIGWDVVGAPVYALPNYTIKMGHTTNATSGTANYVPSATLTQVFRRAIYAPTAGGFDMLSMSTPFVWNGTDNLVVDVCFDIVNPTWNASGQCRIYTSTNGSTSKRSDGGSQCGSTPNSTQQYKPVVQFFIEEGTVSDCATDMDAPTVVTQNITIPLDANGNATTSAAAINNGSSDNCTEDADLTLALSQITFTCANLGANTVTLTVTDESGNPNTETATVTVEDNMAPTAVCLNSTVELQSTGTYTLQQADVFDAVNSSDNCSISTVSFPATTFGCQNLGQTFPITVMVKDPSENPSDCVANITVGLPENLSSPWMSTNIGMVSMGNEYGLNPCATGGAVYTITGSGNNATSYMTDNIAFASQTLCGDGSITAKIENVESTGYGGLMIRETIAAGSKQVAIFSDMSNSLRHESRAMTNGFKTVQSFFKPSPTWLRMRREGNWVHVEYSTNGMMYLPVQSTFVMMGNCVEIGLASFTFLPMAQTTTTFSNVSVTGNIQELTNNAPTAFGADLPQGSAQQSFVRENDVQLYPNPARADFMLQLETSLEQTSMVEVINLYGQSIAQQQLMAGQIQQEWNTTDWSAGTYVLKISRTGQSPLIKQFVVIK